MNCENRLLSLQPVPKVTSEIKKNIEGVLASLFFWDVATCSLIYTTKISEEPAVLLPSSCRQQVSPKRLYLVKLRCYVLRSVRQESQLICRKLRSDNVNICVFFVLIFLSFLSSLLRSSFSIFSLSYSFFLSVSCLSSLFSFSSPSPLSLFCFLLFIYQ